MSRKISHSLATRLGMQNSKLARESRAVGLRLRFVGQPWTGENQRSELDDEGRFDNSMSGQEAPEISYDEPAEKDDDDEDEFEAAMTEAALATQAAEAADAPKEADDEDEFEAAMALAALAIQAADTPKAASAARPAAHKNKGSNELIKDSDAEDSVEAEDLINDQEEEEAYAREKEEEEQLEMADPNDLGVGTEEYFENYAAEDQEVFEFDRNVQFQDITAIVLRNFQAFIVNQHGDEEERPEDQPAYSIGGIDSAVSRAELHARLATVTVTKETSAQMAILRELFPEIDWPRPKSTAEIDSHRLIIVHMCSKGHTAYFGEEYKDLDKCTNHECREPRFLLCKKQSCAEEGACNCKWEDRIPQKRFYYCPILGTILHLLHRNADMFLAALNFRFERPLFDPEQRFEYMDYLDGATARQILPEMHERYQEKVREESHLHGTTDITEISLILGIFYDGIQLFKRRVYHFWPLLSFFMNMHPSYRSEVGGGAFLNAVLPCDQNSGAERVLFLKMFYAELQELAKGILVTIKGQKYFIQVRLANLMMDLPALTKFLKVEGHSSNAGCFLCRSCPGMKLPELKKVVFPYRTRRFLDNKNILRSSGRIGCCCPAQFNTDKDLSPKFSAHVDELHRKKEAREPLDVLEAHFVDRYYPEIDADLFGSERLADTCFECIKPCDWNDWAVRSGQRKRLHLDDGTITASHSLRKMLRFYQTDTAIYKWDHEMNPPWDNIMEVLNFPFCDLRERRTADTLIDRETLLRDGRLAETRGKAVNGVCGVSYVFSELFYTIVEGLVHFDPAHTISGVLKRILFLLKDDYYSTGLKNYCSNYRIHLPYLFADDEVSKKFAIPWLFNAELRALLDAVSNCIVVPLGNTKHHNVKNPFEATGHLRIKDIMSLFTVLFPVFVLVILETQRQQKPRIELGYLDFFLMLSRALTDLQRDHYSEEEICSLENRIIELMAVHEGAFPVREHTYMMHCMLHLAGEIRRCGPIKHWWTLKGERILSLWRTFSHGGNSPDLSLVNQFLNTQFQFEEQIYADNGLKNDRRSHLHNATHTETMSDGTLHYNPLKFRIWRRCITKKTKRSQLQITTFEAERLVQALLQHALNQSANRSDAEEKSPFYKLYAVYRRVTLRKSRKISFIDFMIFAKRFYKQKLSSAAFGIPIRTPNLMRLLSDELLAVANEFVSMHIRPYYKATVFGQEFNGRGMIYREMREAVVQNGDGSPYSLPSNRLSLGIFDRSNFSQTKQYSSWCKYRVDLNNRRSLAEERYAQINFFFRIALPSDNLLNGSNFASITSRRFEKYSPATGLEGQEMNHFSVDRLCRMSESSTMFSSEDPIFIPIQSVLSSPILQLYMDERFKPMCISKNANLKKAYETYYSKAEWAKYIYFFYLLPSKLT